MAGYGQEAGGLGGKGGRGGGGGVDDSLCLDEGGLHGWASSSLLGHGGQEVADRLGTQS